MEQKEERCKKDGAKGKKKNEDATALSLRLNDTSLQGVNVYVRKEFRRNSLSPYNLGV